MEKPGGISSTVATYARIQIPVQPSFSTTSLVGGAGGGGGGHVGGGCEYVRTASTYLGRVPSGYPVSYECLRAQFWARAGFVNSSLCTRNPGFES